MGYASRFLSSFFKVFTKTEGDRKSEIGEGNEKRSRIRNPVALPEGISRQFSLKEIEAATHNFHPDLFIGEGGFGDVYKGFFDDGKLVVAVKRLNRYSRQGLKEFQTEAQLLCQLRHQNLVPLIGICNDKGEMILVYEFMSRGPFSDHLYGKVSVPLAWKQRLQICIGAARGLHYLHTGTKYAVFHRDIKSSNILLDDEWSCKLSDFGLSKLGPPSLSKAPIVKKEFLVAGTLGYMALEYAMHGEFTNKSDVFSFGIVLFEVLCGRQVNENQQNILEWAGEVGREGTIYDIVDPYLKGRIAPECFKKYLEIACSCVHDKGNERPAMGEVEVMLELALELQKNADSEMECINPNGEGRYEEVLFSAFTFDVPNYRNPYSFQSDGTTGADSFKTKYASSEVEDMQFEEFDARD